MFVKSWQTGQQEYSCERPHSALDYRTPEEFKRACSHRKTKTATLFAALDIATGTVFTDSKPRHRQQEFLGFLKRIDQTVPAV